ncbi:DNA mismatch repair protein [Clostridium sp. MT-14]|uniref:MutS-related protein n=1 Tax=Clostridium sp. MT-14 TaxID=3348360 RepID=UPI0035F267D5
MLSALEEYKKRKHRYNLLIKRQQKYMAGISNLRLIIFITGFIALIEMYILRESFIFNFTVLIMLSLLFYLAYLQTNMKTKIMHSAALVKVNQASIKRLNGKWRNFEDIGGDFIDKNHNYSYDLDIFGKGSLFQLINTAHTCIGRQKLKKLLTEKPQDKQNIYDRQSTVVELAHKIYFRQQFEAEGKMIPNNKQNSKELFSWLKEGKDYILKKQLIWALRILSTVTAATTLTLMVKIVYFILAALFDVYKTVPKIFYLVPSYVPVSLILVQCIILKINRKDRIKNLIIAEKYNSDIKMYKNMIGLIEKHEFKSKYIVNLCKKLYSNDGTSAYGQIEAFSKICGSIANRRNILYSILNPILMIEYYWNISVEKWKIKSGNNFHEWIDVIGELEALCSIAVIKYDNPHWCMPGIAAGSSIITAKNMGHPLLEEKNRICNDLKIGESYSVMLVTGSNMSGKSTFLRTVGINIVLAYAGAPVCAEEFFCTIMDLYSCMRVNDNLGQNISSFYAEILRIKNIVEASKKGKRILFLLDEIFKGTNSRDRHTGATILVKQLSKIGNLGFISTHDLELGEMADYRKSKIRNYHFSEYYRNNKIYFDYKLKEGISDTRNAVYLMKLAGIEIEKNQKL